MAAATQTYKRETKKEHNTERWKSKILNVKNVFFKIKNKIRKNVFTSMTCARLWRRCGGCGSGWCKTAKSVV